MVMANKMMKTAVSKMSWSDSDNVADVLVLGLYTLDKRYRIMIKDQVSCRHVVTKHLATFAIFWQLLENSLPTFGH